MEVTSDSECHFIFNSSDEENSHVDDINCDEVDTLCQLLNPKPNIPTEHVDAENQSEFTKNNNKNSINENESQLNDNEELIQSEKEMDAEDQDDVISTNSNKNDENIQIINDIPASENDEKQADVISNVSNEKDQDCHDKIDTESETTKESPSNDNDEVRKIIQNIQEVLKYKNGNVEFLKCDENAQQNVKPKKKKVASKKIPERLLVTRNEFYRETEEKELEKQEKPKRKSKRAIKKMVDRLSQPPQPKQVETEEIPKSKTQTDPQIFDRLYQMSQEKVKKCEKLRQEYEDEVRNDPIRKSSKSNRKSNELVEQQIISFVSSQFIDKEMINEPELISILQNLGLIDHKEMIYKDTTIKPMIESWIAQTDGRTMYNTLLVKETLLHCVTQNDNTRFGVYARQCMTIAFSEMKQKSRIQEPVIQEEERKISRDTIMRLSQTRDPAPKKVVNHNSNLKPKPILNPRVSTISKELPPEGISQRTQEILDSCDLAHISFEERERINAQKRSEKIKKLDEEIHTKKLEVGPQFGQKPLWTSEIQEKLDEYRKKKLEQKPDEPSFRPSIISFKTYQKQIRKQMMAEKNMPEGYNETINRYRQAYQQDVQKKLERAKRDPFYDLTNIPI